MANLAEGVLREHWLKKQTAFDTILAFVTGDGVKLKELKLEPFKTYEEITESAGTASLQGEIAEDRGGKWSASANVAPGAVGVAPDVGPFLEAGYGKETIVGGTSVTYGLDDTTALVGLQAATRVGPYLFNQASGMWVEQITIEGQGSKRPTLSFSGGYARHIFVYGCTIASGSGTSVILTSGHAGNVSVDALVKFAAEDNSGAGYTVTAVSADGLTLTVDPTLAGAVVSGDAVAPVIADPTTTGTIVGGGQDALTLDAVALGVTQYKYTLDTGIRGLGDETDTDRVNRLSRGDRRASVDNQCYYLDTETAPVIGRAWQGAERALIHRIGPNTAAAMVKVNMLAFQPMVTGVETPGTEQSMLKITGKAHQSAAAGDETTLVFD